ncbi:glutathione S-transferase family protein [Roseinatronobacter alkalisoli]|uniref:Glutathione S-transferase family protein n=1 Tax=Roseinatronobacter alkalisoli TaxID=3028235 RepID=A0ABT5T5Q6_9RHOB|nr:glutathione S-transferase family protein [Roseinatronobacter sp. HJB301]MDD7970440.1 glutathione S-transferase family protein [Roseinatronobacter sp. HJB301]
MILYSMPTSGNSYKVRLLLALLGRHDVQRIDVEYLTDALEQAKQQGRLPFGKAPVLVLDDGTLLPESNAILCYLGDDTRFMPQSPVARAQMLGWMFWEQNQHEGVIAVRAALRAYPHRRALATPERMAELLERGHDLLQIMEDHLATRDWLVGDHATLADLCLFAYTHSAGARGGFDMARFPAIGAWIERITQLDGFEGLE